MAAKKGYHGAYVHTFTYLCDCACIDLRLSVLIHVYAVRESIIQRYFSDTYSYFCVRFVTYLLELGGSISPCCVFSCKLNARAKSTMGDGGGGGGVVGGWVVGGGGWGTTIQ